MQVVIRKLQTELASALNSTAQDKKAAQIGNAHLVSQLNELYSTMNCTAHNTMVCHATVEKCHVQGVIRKLQTELTNLESALNSTAHDKKKAQMDNAQLVSQLEANQRATYTAQSAREAMAQELATAEADADVLRSKVAALNTEVERVQGLVHERDQVRWCSFVRRCVSS
jgi:chromosome segregation ATPase